MANIEHIEERVYRPDREDIKSFLEKDTLLRIIAYVICFIALFSAIYTLFFVSKNIDYLARVTFMLTLFLFVGIFTSRNRNQKGSENITPNEQNKKYLMSLGNEAKKFKGSAYKTSKVKNNLIRPLLLDAEQFKRHMQIMATIGAGKSVLMKGMIEQLSLLGGGGFCVDGKGTAEFAKEIFGLLESLGRGDDFIHINFLDMDNTHTINPLLNGTASSIYEILIALLEGEENEWKAKNKAYMKNILKLLIYKRDNEGLKIDFSELSEYLVLAKLIDESIKYKEQIFKSHHLKDFCKYVSTAVNMPFDKFINANEEEIKTRFAESQKNGEQGIYDAGNSAQAWIGIVTDLESDYGGVFNSQTPTISMYEAIQKNKFLFVTLPSMDSDTTPKNLGRLILGLLKGVAAEKAKKSVEPDIPFVSWFDEIGSYIIEGFGRLMSKSRSLGISIIPIYQSSSQIDSVGKLVGSASTERIEMKDTAGTFILMKNMNEEITKACSEMVAQKKVLDKSFTEKRIGAKGDLSAESNFNVEKEDAIKHEEVMAMNNGEMMVFNDGKYYRACAVTERFLTKKGKKIIYEGKNMDIPIPLTQYVPKEKFLRDMAAIWNELKKEEEVA